MNYHGVNCPVCGRPLEENDDIVVCPECGTPHHRECYKKLGHCAMEEELHSKGLAWKNPNEPEDEPKESMICPNCGLLCRGDDSVCPNCHTPLQGTERKGRQVVENAFPSSTGNPEEDKLFGAIYENDDIDGVPAKDFICIVRQNYSYFLRVFKIFANRAKATVFNWSAFFFNYLYFFYRKMYKIGAVLFGVYLLSNVPSVILAFHMVKQIIADPMLAASMQFNMEGLEGLVMASQLLMYARFALSIFCGFKANKYYYKHCRNKIQSLQKVSTGGTPNEYYQTLAVIGGSSMVPPIIIVAVLMLLTLALGTFMGTRLI